MGATFKLLEGFEGVLERPLIAKELHVNHLRLLSAYSADLGAVSTSLLFALQPVCLLLSQICHTKRYHHLQRSIAEKLPILAKNVCLPSPISRSLT